MNVDIQQYLQRVKKEVRQSGDGDLEYFKVFEQEVESFLEENPQADTATIERYFGSPNAIAADYLESLSDENLQEKFRLRRRVFHVIRAVAIALAVVIALLVGIFVYDNYLYTHGEKAHYTSESMPVYPSSSCQTY